MKQNKTKKPTNQTNKKQQNKTKKPTNQPKNTHKTKQNTSQKTMH